MSHLTWEQKLAALQALGECALKMREPGNWYVSDSVELARNGMLESPTVAAATPEAAVNQHWARLVEDVAADCHFRTRSGRRVRWNGFMWVDVPDEAARTPGGSV